MRAGPQCSMKCKFASSVTLEKSSACNYLKCSKGSQNISDTKSSKTGIFSDKYFGRKGFQTIHQCLSVTFNKSFLSEKRFKRCKRSYE